MTPASFLSLITPVWDLREKSIRVPCRDTKWERGAQASFDIVLETRGWLNARVPLIVWDCSCSACTSAATTNGPFEAKLETLLPHRGMDVLSASVTVSALTDLIADLQALSDPGPGPWTTRAEALVAQAVAALRALTLTN